MTLVVDDGDPHGKPFDNTFDKLELESDDGLWGWDILCNFKIGSGTPCLFNIGVKSGHGSDKGVSLGVDGDVEINDESFIKRFVILTPEIDVDGVGVECKPEVGFAVEDGTVPHGELDKVLNELEFLTPGEDVLCGFITWPETEFIPEGEIVEPHNDELGELCELGKLGECVFEPLQGVTVLTCPEIREVFDIDDVGTAILVGEDNKSLIRWLKTFW